MQQRRRASEDRHSEAMIERAAVADGDAGSAVGPEIRRLFFWRERRSELRDSTFDLEPCVLRGPLMVDMMLTMVLGNRQKGYEYCG